ncbi:MAG: sigma 54-interacting transcriptional regulator [Verrucomicrobiota bacterium]
MLQDQEVRPVGGKTSYADQLLAFIAATNRDPEEAIKDGKLREDLYYRISAISVSSRPCATAATTSCRWPMPS